MVGSKLYGVELDSITGRIARQLYQNANIAVQGYENSNLPDSFFDLAVGNVPFGNYGIADKRYDKNNFLIHDYYFAKTLDKLRPGGMLAVEIGETQSAAVAALFQNAGLSDIRIHRDMAGLDRAVSAVR